MQARFPRRIPLMMRILLVEDDELIGSGVEFALRQAGYAVDWARDGRQAELALATHRYALVVLDLGLPVRSGGDLLKALRDGGNDVPVLVLTARGTIADRVRGLDAGADDYLGKPFDLTELLARCRALVRRSQGRSVESIVWRNLSVDLLSQCVMRDETRAVLTQLITHQGIPQSRTDLEDSLYGWQEEIESNAIEVHVSKLRKKLGADLITTVRGIGYVIAKEKEKEKP
jgi:two-component system response regulator QseB